MSTICPYCQHHINCLQCDHGICEACGADLWAEDAIPFTDEPLLLSKARDRWLEDPEARRIYEESEPDHQEKRLRIIRRWGKSLQVSPDDVEYSPPELGDMLRRTPRRERR